MIALVAELPALPLHTAGKYVAAAYVVVFAIVLIYVAIMAIRLGRIERELGELLALADGDPERPHARARETAPHGDRQGEPRESQTRESAPA
jgi:hypothetical protein